MNADTKKSKVLVITSSYPRHEQDYAVPWMRESHARLVQQGHDITVLAPAYKGLKTHEIDGLEIKRFRYAPAFLETLTHEEGATYRVRKFWMQFLAIPYIILGCIAAARCAWRGGYDVIHVHWPFPHGLMGQCARLVSGSRLVIMSHGAEFALARRKKWIRPFLRQSLRAADLRIANSSDTAANVIAISDMRCEVVPFGTTVQQVESTNHQNERPRVLFTGRLIERKGLEYLLQAVPAILQRQDADFVITGNGDQRAKLEKICDQLQLHDRVQFLGFVSNEELRDQYARCDVWVNPGIVDSWGDAEGLGIGSIEAYNYGKPVVASRVGGIPDTVVDGVTGFLVAQKDSAALADAICNLICDPAKAQKMGAAGFRYAKQTFDWDSITKRLGGLFASVQRQPSTAKSTALAQRPVTNAA